MTTDKPDTGSDTPIYDKLRQETEQNTAEEPTPCDTGTEDGTD